MDVRIFSVRTRSQFSPASFSMLMTVRFSTPQGRAVPRTELPSTRQSRIRPTVSCGSRTSVPNGFSRASDNRFPNWWHLSAEYCGVRLRLSPSRFCTNGTSFWTLLSSGEGSKMAVDLNNPALGLSEVRPREWLALRTGPNSVVRPTGSEPATFCLVDSRSIRTELRAQMAKGQQFRFGNGFRWPFCFTCSHVV